MVDLAASSVIGRELFLASMLSSARRLGSLMHRFALQAEDVILESGKPLYRAGESSEYFFFVVSGEVRLSRPGAADSVFHEREVLGTIDALLGRPHAHTAVATKPTRLLRILATEWADALEDNFEMAVHAISQISKRVLSLRQRPSPLGGFDDPTSCERMPASDLQVVDRILRLRSVPAFARASTQSLAALAQIGSTASAHEGEVIFAAGETKGSLVVVASGEVSMAWGESGPPARFGEGSMLGGGTAFSDTPFAEVRAVSSARAIVLPREDYDDVMEEHFDLVQSTLAALSEERHALLDRGS